MIIEGKCIKCSDENCLRCSIDYLEKEECELCKYGYETNGKNCSKCTLDNCASCHFYKGKEIYLVGDANTALQYALLLSTYCPKVHMITLFDKLFGDKILIDRVLQTENIDIRHNMCLKELKGVFI